MKKILYTFGLFFYFALQAYSCDPIILSFCESSGGLTEEVIVLARITDKFNNGVELSIIEGLRGQTEANIKVWDGTDIECNGPFPMNVNPYGNIGDTLICMVQEIDEIQNTWEVIGDYRRPSSINDITYLGIENGLVLDYFLDPLLNIADYKSYWMDSCVTLNTTGILANEPLAIFPNPVQDKLNIYTNRVLNSYSISSINGQVIQPTTNFKYTNAMSVKKLAPGMYIIRLEDEEGEITVHKFIKD